MNPVFGHGLVRVVMVIGVSMTLDGCYYMQAARGQLEVMRHREPIQEVIQADATPAELSRRLRIVEQARQFSIDQLGLPDNNSYRSYADLERDYVIWNVIAAPEFSLQPKRWCYPIVGCVSYRGYFSEAQALRKAAQLREDGYDVAFGGVAAYSTLGRFSDPILNTMMHWEDVDLVAVMFHELAHQLLYVKHDSGFNESFATAVEEIGVERWLTRSDHEHELVAYRERRELRRRLMQLVEAARNDLDEIYASALQDEQKRTQKKMRLKQLANVAETLFADAGRKAPSWLVDDLNNARLVSTTLYHGRLPAFRALLKKCNNDIPCFYAQAEALSTLDKKDRDTQLDKL